MQVFKKKDWIEVSIFLSQHLLCNISQDFEKFNFCSYQYWLETLIDCGAGGTFVAQNFTKMFEIKTLKKPIKAFNVDSTKNKKGTIKSYVDLESWIEHKKFKERFYVIRKQKIILGFLG